MKLGRRKKEDYGFEEPQTKETHTPPNHFLAVLGIQMHVSKYKMYLPL